MIGGGGAGRVGARSRIFCTGGFGGGRFGIMIGGALDFTLINELAGGPFGIGGGARGFSKLPS